MLNTPNNLFVFNWLRNKMRVLLIIYSKQVLNFNWILYRNLDTRKKGTHHLDASITGNCLAWLASFMLHLPLIEAQRSILGSLHTQILLGSIYTSTNMPYTLAGPTVTRPVPDPPNYKHLHNRIYMSPPFTIWNQ